MARTITALFDTRADADAGAERLRQAGIDASGVTVHDQTNAAATPRTDATAGTAPAYSTHEDKGLWASIKGAFLPRADRHRYEEGVRRGGFLLTANVPDDRTPDAVRALEDANSVDLEAREREWRESGWDYADDRYDDVLDREEDARRDLEVGGTRYRTYVWRED